MNILRQQPEAEPEPEAALCVSGPWAVGHAEASAGSAVRLTRVGSASAEDASRASGLADAVRREQTISRSRSAADALNESRRAAAGDDTEISLVVYDIDVDQGSMRLVDSVPLKNCNTELLGETQTVEVARRDAGEPLLVRASDRNTKTGAPHLHVHIETKYTSIRGRLGVRLVSCIPNLQVHSERLLPTVPYRASRCAPASGWASRRRA